MRANQVGKFLVRENALVQAMGMACARCGARCPARPRRFYMARGMYPEAKGAPIWCCPSKAGFEEIRSADVARVANIRSGIPSRA